MRQTYRGIIGVFLLLVLSTFSLVAHTAGAQPMGTPHTMMGVRTQLGLESCVSVCTTETIHKQDTAANKGKKENPQPPFYAQFQASPIIAIKMTHDQQTRSLAEKEPPPNPGPAYITLGVFRT